MAASDPAAYAAAWRARHPDRAKAQSAAKLANAKARRYGLTGRIRGSDVLALWQQQPECLACGAGQGLDHIVAFADGGGNAADNLQNLCATCNMRKEADRRRTTPRCKRGHLLVGENLYRSPSVGERRHCRACQSERERHRARRRHVGTV